MPTSDGPSPDALTSTPSGSAEGSVRRRLVPLSVVVLVVGLLLSAGVAWAVAASNERDEQRLLGVQVEQGRAYVASVVQNLTLRLAATAEVASATGAAPASFDAAASRDVGSHEVFASLSLWRVGSHGRVEVAAVGGTPEAAATGQLPDLLARADSRGGLHVAEVAGAGAPRLGFSLGAAPSAGLVVYAESPLPKNRRVPPAPGPFSDLRYALYLHTSSGADRLLEEDAPMAPGGGQVRLQLPIGDRTLLLVASARRPLIGALPQALPWVIVAVGVVLSAAGAAVAHRMTRSRDRAEALASANAQLFTEQRSISDTLQRALLPAELPPVDGAVVAARYVAGTRGMEVGGDWYDVVPVGAGRFVFVVGDVSGHGLRAAAVMARLHFAIRAYALQGDKPHRILSKLGPVLSLEDDGHFATAVCGLADAGARTLSWVSAGHPPPLVVAGTRSRFAVSAPAPPLGTDASGGYRPQLLQLASDETVVVYTDGLVERRGEHLDVGLQRLKQVAAAGPATPDALVGRLVDELVPDGPVDDVAILAFCWADAPGGCGPPTSTT